MSAGIGVSFLDNITGSLAASAISPGNPFRSILGLEFTIRVTTQPIAGILIPTLRWTDDLGQTHVKAFPQISVFAKTEASFAYSVIIPANGTVTIEVAAVGIVSSLDYGLGIRGDFDQIP